MKRIFLLLTSILTGATLFLAGCSGGDSVNTEKVESSFSDADPSTKGSVGAVVAAVKAQNWSAAGAELQKLASNAKLTPEQKTAITDLWDQVKARVSAAATHAEDAASKAMKDAGTATDKAVKDLGNQLKK